MEAQEIIRMIDDHQETTGNLPSTICQNALKNPKYYERLKRQVEKNAESGQRLKVYFAKTAPSKAVAE